MPVNFRGGRLDGEAHEIPLPPGIEEDLYADWRPDRRVYELSNEQGDQRGHLQIDFEPRPRARSQRIPQALAAASVLIYASAALFDMRTGYALVACAWILMFAACVAMART